MTIWLKKTFSIFIFNYKNFTLLAICFLFSEVCIGNSKEQKMKTIKSCFLLFLIQTYENQKQSENKVAFV